VNRLTPILDATRAEVIRRRAACSPGELEAAVAERPDDIRPFADALQAPGVSIIAEHKRRSPSAGTIREDLSLEAVVSAYEAGGAAALSVLTEPDWFGGSLEDLRRARAASSLPVLRKDFIVDSWQIDEAYATGADAILLIVAAVSSGELAEYHARARSLGLAALVEVHDSGELGVAAAAGAEIIGVNNRDLTTLEVDVRRTHALLDTMPSGVVVVAESGFSRSEELAELAAAGLDAVLIGEALMRAPDLEVAVRELARPAYPS
jgi:indole-3-glycerol phosphate synthase